MHCTNYHSSDFIYAYRIIVPLFADSMSTRKMSIENEESCVSRSYNVRIFLPRLSKTEFTFIILSIFVTVCTSNSIAVMAQPPEFYEQRSPDFSMAMKTALEDETFSIKYSQEGLVADTVTLNEFAAAEAAASVAVDTGFLDAFTASFSVILVTELGDKTFFIAAIMAMRHPRLIIFTGAISALALMTVLSVIFGMATTIVPKIYTYYVSTALFAIFGLKMIYEGYRMKDSNSQEELEEVQSDLRKREDELERDVNVALVEDMEGGLTKRTLKKSPAYVTTRVIMQAFTMTFLAEWGDRSQLTTIILAASKNVYGVVSGGVIGHFICTGVAVIGGRMVATKISVRTVTLIGGVVFLSFAFYALMMRPNDL